MQQEIENFSIKIEQWMCSLQNSDHWGQHMDCADCDRYQDMIGLAYAVDRILETIKKNGEPEAAAT